MCDNPHGERRTTGRGMMETIVDFLISCWVLQRATFVATKFREFVAIALEFVTRKGRRSA